MKVAHILHQFPKLSETFILNQITSLLDLGCNIDIYAFLRPNEPKVHSDVLKYNLLSRTKYVDLPSNRKYSLYYILCLFLEKNKSLYLSFLKEFLKRKSFYESLKKSLLFLYLGQRYNIIHCHYGSLGQELSFLKDFLKIKLVTSFHGFDIAKILHHFPPDYYNDLFLKGDLFLPISNHWKKKLIQLGCPDDKIVVHRMGIFPERFQFKIRSIKRPFKFLTVGRLVEKKGIHIAVKALAKIKDELVHFQYLIAGDGPWRTKLEKMVYKYGLHSQVKILGHVAQNEVKNLMSETQIFLLPSLTSSDGDQEGIPVVLMEAMASGLPVISTYHSGIPELISHNECGFLVPENDIDSLADMILHVAKLDRKSLEKIVLSARNKIVNEYNIHKQALKLLNIYKDLLND